MFIVFLMMGAMDRWGESARTFRLTRALAVFISFSLIPEILIEIHGAPAEFDVREHLSSSTSYAAGKGIKYGNVEAEDVPAGCVPILFNLVARHGTRGPTKKRIKELEDFADRLEKLASDAEKASLDVDSLPAWIKGWKSPWEGKKVGGELLPRGEEELYDLAQRYRNRFPDIFSDEYHPDVYPIIATQVGRSSASSVAFGMGMFTGQGTLGPGKQRAFAVLTDSKGRDIHLRFHDTCMAYKESKKLRKPKVVGWQEQAYTTVAMAVTERYGMAVTNDDVTSLWLLCKNEASLLDVIDGACGLFTAEEVELLEWADDLEMHHLKGYGATINYRMGVPLLDDVVQSMERAMAVDKSHSDKATEKARLRFAHAETVIPFTCLLGLFLEDDDMKNVQSEQPLQAPMRPPQRRLWRGSLVAPFAANTALVLYKCPSDSAHGKYLVQALHNEKPVAMPACNGSVFCPFEVFKEQVVAPHMKQSFDTLCRMEVVHKPVRFVWIRKLLAIPSYLFRWPFSSTEKFCHSNL